MKAKQPPRVLLLGATSTVASDVARIYAGRGARLFLVGRSQEKLARLCSELNDARIGSVLGSESLDFTDTESSPAVIERAIATLGGLDIALIAHGYLGDQLESERSFEEAAASIATNYTSVIAQVIPLANHFERQGAGTLAAIGSVAGDRGRPRNYTYGAAKGALALYLQGVRSRLYPHVTVTTIKLGPVDTPMTTNHEKNASFVTSEKAAAGIVRAIDRGAGEVYVPSFWRLVMLVVRNLPEVVFQRMKFLSGR